MDANAMSVPAVRRDLNKPTGELIESFQDFDTSQVLEFQAALLAIKRTEEAAGLPADERTNLFKVSSHQEIADLMSAKRVHFEPFDEALREVKSKQGVPEGVPQAGMIAVSLGLVSRETKDALMAAQAGERTRMAAEDLEKIDGKEPGNKAAFLDNLVRHRGNPEKQARFFIGGFGKDPENLKAAQAAQHLADLLKGAVALDPSQAADGALKDAAEAMKSVSSLAVRRSVGDLVNAGEEDAAARLAHYAAASKETPREDALGVLKQALEESLKKLGEKGILSAEEVKETQVLAHTRAEQAETLAKIPEKDLVAAYEQAAEKAEKPVETLANPDKTASPLSVDDIALPYRQAMANDKNSPIEAVIPRADTVEVAFKSGNKLHDTGQTIDLPDQQKGCSPKEIQTMVAAAKAHGWDTIAIKGTPEFSAKIWLEAQRQEMPTSGYEPPKDVRDRWEKELAAMKTREAVKGKPQEKPEVVNRIVAARLARTM